MTHPLKRVPEVSISKVIDKRIKAVGGLTNHHLSFIAHTLMTDLKLPVVRFEIFYDRKEILVGVRAVEGGPEYFIRPKKDPFPDLIRFLELDYTIRFRTKNDRV
jgi:hypothetical protein